MQTTNNPNLPIAFTDYTQGIRKVFYAITQNGNCKVKHSGSHRDVIQYYCSISLFSFTLWFYVHGHCRPQI